MYYLFLFFFFCATACTGPTHKIRKLNNPLYVTYNNNGKLCAVVDGSIAQLQMIDGTTNTITQVNGQLLLYKTDDCAVQKKCPRGVFNLSQPFQALFSPDNRTLFIATYGQLVGMYGGVTQYEITHCALNPIFSIPGLTTPSSIALSSDGSLLAVADLTPPQGRVLLYQIIDGLVVNPNNPAVKSCFGVESIHLAFSPDGTLLAVSDNSKHKVPIYEIQNGTFAQAKPFCIRGLKNPGTILFTPQSDLIIAENRCNGRALRYTFENGKFIRTGQLKNLHYVTALSVTSDGNTLAVGEFFSGKTKLFSLNSPCIEFQQTIHHHCLTGTSSLAFKPGSDCLAIAYERSNQVIFTQPEMQ